MTEPNVDTNDKGEEEIKAEEVLKEEALKAQAAKDALASGKGEQMVPKSRFDQVIQQRTEALDSLKAVADELIADVPEEFKSIIPDLAPAAKITWLRNCQKTGIFTKKVVDGLDTKQPGGKKQVDYSDMKSTDMISKGYNK